MRNYLRNWALTVGLVVVGMAMSCGEVEIFEATDPEVQLAEDIASIEEFIGNTGYTEYDTLESEIRVLVLDEGDGEDINYNDFIWYNYSGYFLDSLMFDTSVESIAIAQDQPFVVDTTFLKSVVNPELDSLDNESNKVIDFVTYEEGYFTVYTSNRIYEPYYTTHTPTGWFIKQQTFIDGFKEGVHETFERVKLGGSVLVCIPSVLAYGASGAGLIAPNTPLIFEISPTRKK